MLFQKFLRVAAEDAVPQRFVPHGIPQKSHLGGGVGPRRVRAEQKPVRTVFLQNGKEKFLLVTLLSKLFH